MRMTEVWAVVATTAITIAVVQWWAMRTVYRRDLAAARARFQASQQAADTMLQQARRQYAQIQQELAVLRQLAPRPASAAAGRAETTRRDEARARSRDGLLNILDDDAQRRTLPRDGFASTLPSQQFPISAFGTSPTSARPATGSGR